MEERLTLIKRRIRRTPLLRPHILHHNLLAPIHRRLREPSPRPKSSAIPTLTLLLIEMVHLEHRRNALINVEPHKLVRPLERVGVEGLVVRRAFDRLPAVELPSSSVSIHLSLLPFLAAQDPANRGTTGRKRRNTPIQTGQRPIIQATPHIVAPLVRILRPIPARLDDIDLAAQGPLAVDALLVERAAVVVYESVSFRPCPFSW